MPIIGRDLAIAKGLPLKKWFLHSVIFEKKKWSKEQSKQWLKENKHYYIRYSDTANYHRWNQSPEILGASFKTKKLPNGISLVYEWFM